MNDLRQVAQAALDDVQCLLDVLNEAMCAGGWIPTPLQSSFREAWIDAGNSLPKLRAALAQRVAPSFLGVSLQTRAERMHALWGSAQDSMPQPRSCITCAHLSAPDDVPPCAACLAETGPDGNRSFNRPGWAPRSPWGGDPSTQDYASTVAPPSVGPAPNEILDRNGEVVLGLCRRCGKAESELSDAWAALLDAGESPICEDDTVANAIRRLTGRSLTLTVSTDDTFHGSYRITDGGRSRPVTLHRGLLADDMDDDGLRELYARECGYALRLAVQVEPLDVDTFLKWARS